MQVLKKLILTLLLIVTPALFTYPPEPTKPIRTNDHEELTYDNIVHLIQSIEAGTIDPHKVDIKKVKAFVASLANQGLQEGENIDDDIDELLDGNETSFKYSFYTDHSESYFIIPGVYTSSTHIDLLHSKSWFAKQWKQVKKFVKEHKKEIIAGAVVVAVVTIAVVTSSSPGDVGSLTSSDIKSKADEHTDKIKEKISQLPDKNHDLSIEERAKIIGSLYAHDMLAHTPISQITRDTIDQNFATDYALLYENQHRPVEALYHHVLGEHSLANHHLEQAVEDCNDALAIDPTMPESYLNRSVANFGLGNYKESLHDFDTYSDRQHKKPTSDTFTKAFVRGAMQGAKESGKGVAVFVYDLATHPIHTARQVYDAMSTLKKLATTGEWGEIGKTLSPEIHSLITNWHTLTEEQRGQLAGHAFGSLGADIAIPGATAKALSKCAKGARLINKAGRQLHTAERTLLLESTSTLKTPTKVKTFVNSTTKTLSLAEELGLPINKLIEAGTVHDRAGFTKVGRALTKHGYREGSIFPKPVGNPMQINKHGKAMLKEILSESNPRIIKKKSGNLKIYDRKGRGAEFTKDGNFKGFVEWQYEK